MAFDELPSLVLRAAEATAGVVVGWVVAGAVLMVVHELAHVLVGRALGFRPLLVRLGGGVPVATLWFAGVRLELARGPTGGHVAHATTRAHRLGGRWAAVCLAGPAADLGIALALQPALREAVQRGSDGLGFGSAASSAAIVLASLRALAAWLPVPGLRGVRGDVGQATEALRWDARATEAAFAEWQCLAVEHAAWDAFHRGDLATAEATLARGAERWPQSGAWSFLRGVIHSLRGDVDAALGAFAESAGLTQRAIVAAQAEVARASARARLRVLAAEADAAALVNRAFVLMLVDDGSGFAEAGECLDGAEAAAATLRPNAGSHAAVLRTRGLLQLRLGCVAEAAVSLRQAFALAEPFWLRAISAAALADAEEELRRPWRARRLRRAARWLHAQSPLVARWRQLRDADRARAAAMR
jgi:tetratricopeptide (TPR) repeat protein